MADNKVNSIITEKFIAKVNDTGKLPWSQPWTMIDNCNYQSKHIYTGVNRWMTALSDYACPYWLSYKKVIELGGSFKEEEAKNAGQTGIQGLVGQTGLQGVQGIQGLQGDQGSTGLQGVEGQTGTIGTTGGLGPTGLIGSTGVQGITGAPWAASVRGARVCVCVCACVRARALACVCSLVCRRQRRTS